MVDVETQLLPQGVTDDRLCIHKKQLVEVLLPLRVIGCGQIWL